MMKFLAVPLLALGLAACETVQMGEVDHQAYAQFAVSQVETYNALGMNPIQMDEQTLNYVVALCGTVVGAFEAGLVRVDGVNPEDVLTYCEVAVTAAR